MVNIQRAPKVSAVLKKRPTAGAAANDKRAHSGPKRATGLFKARRIGSVSRKTQLAHLAARVKVKREQRDARQAVKAEAAEAVTRKAQNKKSHRTLDATVQRSVTDGVRDTVTQAGEKPTPLAMFAAAMTALDHAAANTNAGASIPYLLSTVGATVPHLSAAVVMARLDAVRAICERVIHVTSAKDATATARAFRLLGDFARRCVDAPLAAVGTARGQSVKVTASNVQATVDKAWAALKALEPSKINAPLVVMYLQMARKFWQRVFAMGHLREENPHAGSDDEDGSSPATGPNLRRGLEHPELAAAVRQAVLTRIADVHVGLLPLFYETRPAVAEAAARDLRLMMRGPIEFLVRDLFGASDAGTAGVAVGRRAAALAEVLEVVVRDTTELFRASVPREHWAVVLRYLASVFTDSLSVFKRRGRDGLPALMDVAPTSGLLVRVIDKLRVASASDAPFVSACDAALTAVAGCMPISTLLDLIPLFPADAATPQGHVPPVEARRYLLYNVLRRVAHHDDLGFFVDNFAPRIEAARRFATEALAQERDATAADAQMLVQQYCRLAVGFCDHPVMVTDVAFRTFAKCIVVGLLSTPQAHVGCHALQVLCDSYHRLANATNELDDAVDEEEAAGDEEAEDTADYSARLERRDDSVMNPHHYHMITRETATKVCTIFAKYSVNIMPKLCNAAEQLGSATSVLRAIETFARVCAPNVMSTVFKGILDMADNVANVPGSMGRDMTARRRVLLDIGHSLVPHLEKDTVTAVFERIVKPVLAASGDEDALGSGANATLQKKAYKLLLALFEHRLGDFAPHLEAAVATLAAAREHTSGAALKVRLRCLGWAVDAHKMLAPPEVLLRFMLTAVDEVVLYTREKSSFTRAGAMDLLGKMLRFAENIQTDDAVSPTRQMLHRALAGLAGTTPTAIGCSLAAAAKLLWAGHRQFGADTGRLIGFGFSLIDHVSQEVRTAAVLFARTAIKLGASAPAVDEAIVAVPAEGQQPPLHRLLRGIAMVMSQPQVSSSTRTTMRQLLERLLKRYGLATLEPIFPAGSRKYLQYVARLQRRAERTKERERVAEQQKQMLAKMRRAEAGGIAYVEQNDELDDMDLLEEGAMLRMAAARAAAGARVTTNAGDDSDEDDADDDWHMEMGEDGGIRIMQRSEKLAADEEASRLAMAEKLLRSGKASRTQGPTIAAATVNDDRKRRRTEDVEDFENAELLRIHTGETSDAQAMQKIPGGSASKPSLGTQKLKEQSNARRDLKRQRLEADVKKGDEYAATGAMGDVKKGNVDPYAYVPLNRAMLNKRLVASGARLRRFKSVVHKGLKGNKASQHLANMQK